MSGNDRPGLPTGVPTITMGDVPLSPLGPITQMLARSPPKNLAGQFVGTSGSPVAPSPSSSANLQRDAGSADSWKVVGSPSRPSPHDLAGKDPVYAANTISPMAQAGPKGQHARRQARSSSFSCGRFVGSFGSPAVHSLTGSANSHCSHRDTGSVDSWKVVGSPPRPSPHELLMDTLDGANTSSETAKNGLESQRPHRQTRSSSFSGGQGTLPLNVVEASFALSKTFTAQGEGWSLLDTLNGANTGNGPESQRPHRQARSSSFSGGQSTLPLNVVEASFALSETFTAQGEGWSPLRSNQNPFVETNVGAAPERSHGASDEAGAAKAVVFNANHNLFSRSRPGAAQPLIGTPLDECPAIRRRSAQYGGGLSSPSPPIASKSQAPLFRKARSSSFSVGQRRSDFLEHRLTAHPLFGAASSHVQGVPEASGSGRQGLAWLSDNGNFDPLSAVREDLAPSTLPSLRLQSNSLAVTQTGLDMDGLRRRRASSFGVPNASTRHDEHRVGPVTRRELQHHFAAFARPRNQAHGQGFRRRHSVANPSIVSREGSLRLNGAAGLNAAGPESHSAESTVDDYFSTRPRAASIASAAGFASKWSGSSSHGPEDRRQSALMADAHLGKGVPLRAVPHGELYIVEFKAGRSDLFYGAPWCKQTLKKDDLVVVEGDRGMDLGKVVSDRVTPLDVLALQQRQAEAAAVANMSLPAAASLPHREPRPKRIYRLAQPAEVMMLVNKSQCEGKAILLCQAKIQQMGLPMEVVDAEFQWDRRKLTFYFIAKQRVDFRELVRDMFKIYRTRVWMCAIDPSAASLAAS